MTRLRFHCAPVLSFISVVLANADNVVAAPEQHGPSEEQQAAKAAAASTPTESGGGTQYLLQEEQCTLRFPFQNDGTWIQQPLPNDDEYFGPVVLPFVFRFYCRNYSTVFINNNGNLTFESPLPVPFTPSAFPIAGLKMVAPFWADVDTRLQSPTNTPTRLVWHKFFDTDAAGGYDTFVVTWDHVGYYGGQVGPHTDKLNTFQVAISNRSLSQAPDQNVCFSYCTMQWTTGDASGPGGGFGGNGAIVGLNFLTSHRTTSSTASL
jgi:hypothetical protein